MAEAHKPAGVGVDAQGGPVVDPTANVQALSEASNKRQDDLRDAQNVLLAAQIHRLESMAILRAEHAKEIRQLEAEHNASLRRAESARLDSIRAVDREDVSKTAAQVLNSVNTLATSAAATAETLRNQRTADAADFSKRLGAVELALSEGKGKQTVSDPQMERLTALVESLSRTRAVDAGASTGSSDTIKMIALVISMFVGLILIGTFVFVTQRQPAPVYYPAPVGSTLPTSPPTQVPR